MAQLLEFIPLIGFFVSYKLFDIYMAVIVLMVMMTAVIALQALLKKQISNMQLVSWLLVLVFGSVTLVFRNEMFLKWKPTVLNWGLGLAFLISNFTKATLVERLFVAMKLEAPASVWKKLNLSWALFFFFTGALNLFIAYYFSTDFWVNFKVFGLLGLTLLFVFGQAFYLKNVQSESASP